MYQIRNLHHEPCTVENMRECLENWLGLRCVFPASDEDRPTSVLTQQRNDNRNVNLVGDSKYTKLSPLYGIGSYDDQWSARCMIERTDLTDTTKNSAVISKDSVEDIIAKMRFTSSIKLFNDHLSDAIHNLADLIVENAVIEDCRGMPITPQLMSWIPNSSLYPHHPNITKLMRTLVTDQHVVMIHAFAKHSLLSVARFHASTTLSSGTLSNTTGLGCKDLRLRFIIYQLLEAVHFLHSQGLCLDSLQPSSIMIDDDMWLSLPVGLSDRTLSCVAKKTQLCKTDKDAVFSEACVDRQMFIPRPPGYYEPLTIQWVSGKISNFEYLMAINYGAGRTMMDPLYHPILPWVTDFTSNCLNPLEVPSFRDLSMTKFRLSKGDTQLETTYRHSEPPHHIPESLSELTYYIYMARRTPMQVLRRVVRDVFVPEHYPHSMHRIYEWTPDECIPEFYFDTSVFKSIHKNYGLPDLDFPPFAPTSEEFICYHRAVLESDYVSSQLHSWIDLTFGYCLEGDAAIEHMNVPLKHTLTSSERMGLDSPNVNKNPGFVMLFDRPHPKRQIKNARTSSHIYSYDNSKGKSMSFHDLNPKLHFDNSNKFFSVNSGDAGTTGGLQGDLSKNSFGIDRLIELDPKYDFASGSGSSGRSNFSKETSHLLSHYHSQVEQISTNSGLNSPAGISGNTGKKQKKSLSRPTADLSLSKLKQADFIDLSKDGRCLEYLDNLVSQTQHYKFTVRTGNSIDGCYCLTDAEAVLPSDEFAPVDGVWDAEFIQSMILVQRLLSKVGDNNDHIVAKLQAQDLFAVGCMIAELYLGRTLLSVNDVMQIKQSSVVDAARIIYRGTAGLPLVVRRIIALLLQPDESSRPRMGDILSACTLANSENPIIPRDIPPLATFYNLFDRKEEAETARDKLSGDKDRFVRIEMLADHCNSLFPEYFKVVYSVVGAVKLASDGLMRLNVILLRIDDIETLPLEGINLALFHLLEVIGDSTPFQRSFDADENSSEFLQCAAVLREYWRFVDVVGSRLGLEATEKLLVPQVVKFFNTFQSGRLLKFLIESPIWNVMVLRAGVRCFLRSFLPLLLTYVCSGTLHGMLYRSRFTDDAKENAPLWSTSDANDKSEWLRNCPHDALQAVQYAAYLSLSNLADADSLGCGLTSRYIIPSLMSLVGVPHLALSGFESRDDKGIPVDLVNRIMVDLMAQSSGERKAMTSDDRPVLDDFVVTIESNVSNGDMGVVMLDRDTLEAFVNKKAHFNAQDMYVIKALVQMSTKLGELVVSELILSTIFNLILPDLESQMVPLPKEGVAAAFMEVILLLNGMLPVLSAEVIQQSVLQPSRLSGSCLPKLLSTWPLVPAWQFLDDAVGGSLVQTDVIASIENVRLHSVLLELCRLIVSTSMIAGSDACAESVLPHVDTFFKNFVQVFGMIPVESKAMMKAFELGAEIYLPLVQLMGAEAFYTAVPNLNPRLELWLGSIGSSIPPRSPPLPSNIWPEVTNETSNQPEKKKGIMQWISGRSKWMSSLTSSNTPAGPGSLPASSTPTPAVTMSTPFTLPRSTIKSDDPKVNIQDSGGHLSNVHSNVHLSNMVETQSARKVSVSNKQSVIGQEGSEMLVTPKRPSYTAKLLARTPGTSSKEYTPTQGTELVELDSISTPLPPKHKILESSTAGHSSANGNYLIDVDDNDGQKPGNSVETLPINHNDDSSTGEISIGNSKKKRTIEDHDIELDSIDSDIDAADISSDEEPRDQLPPTLATPASKTITEIFKEVHTPHPAIDSVDKKIPLPEGNAISEEVPIHNLLVSNDINNSGDEILTPLAGSPEMRTFHQSPQATPKFLSTKQPKENSSRLLFERTNKAAISGSHRNNPYKVYQKLMHGRGKNQQRASSAKRVPQTTRRSSTTASSKSILYSSNDLETAEEVEARELRCSETAWLLAGNGRWNVDKEMKDRASREQNKLLKGAKHTFYHVNHNEWNPAAQMSMTAPKIAVDVAGDTGSFINFQLHSNTQWKLEDAPGLIRCMVTNPAESLLMTCSRTAVRLWSLSSHPLQHVSSYTSHSLPPFNGAFLRTGQHAMTCDGSVHVWDIESRHALSIISPPDKLNGFSSATVIPSKFGVHPSIDAVGDEQILCTVQDSVCYYDVRCYFQHKPLQRVAEWTLPQIPPPQGNFMTSTIEPLQLTCAASHEHYVFAGSNSGGLWVLDRRMGKVLYSWQGHDSPILKVFDVLYFFKFDVWSHIILHFQINPVSERHFLAVSEKSAAVWEYISDPIHTPSSLLLTSPSSLNPSSSILSSAGNVISQREYLDPNMNISTGTKENISAATIASGGAGPTTNISGFHVGLGGIGEVKRSLSIKSATEGVYSSSNLILTSFDSSSVQLGTNAPGAINGPGGVTMGGGGIRYGGLEKDIGLSSKPQHVLYCLSGHKLYSGFLPTFDVTSRDRINVTSSFGKEVRQFGMDRLVILINVHSTGK